MRTPSEGQRPWQARPDNGGGYAARCRERGETPGPRPGAARPPSSAAQERVQRRSGAKWQEGGGRRIAPSRPWMAGAPVRAGCPEERFTGRRLPSRQQPKPARSRTARRKAGPSPGRCAPSLSCFAGEGLNAGGRIRPGFAQTAEAPQEVEPRGEMPGPHPRASRSPSPAKRERVWKPVPAALQRSGRGFNRRSAATGV